MSVRRVALEVLMDITDGGAYANLRLKQALAGVDEKDAKWISAAVYTALDNLIYLDYVIEHYAKGRLKPAVRGVLRLGVCQLLFMDVPQSAACNESVKLIKEIGKTALSGYVNGVMREICRNRENPAALPDDPVERLSIEFSYPKYLCEEYVSLYGLDFASQLLSFRRHGMSVRAQYPYTSDELVKVLEKRGISFVRGGLVPDAIILEQGLNVEKEPLFTSGKISVQSESAMLACLALGDVHGKNILDACAAPGGKSAYLSSLMQGSGHISAWELHEHRTALIKATFSRLGVMNAQVHTRDASVLIPELESTYDAVLVDAPCSGLGVSGKPDVKYAKTSGLINEISQVQHDILSACSRYVKPGGVLLYVTCTVSKRENEDNALRFLSEHSEFVLSDIRPFLPEALRARAGNGMIQLFPHIDGTDGFFIARFERL